MLISKSLKFNPNIYVGDVDDKYDDVGQVNAPSHKAFL